ncbi:MAG: hypothetical protein IT524_04115 [Nitrosomonas sp.]|nr:hypothetical protein [Nitrosomonas sp.]
MNSVDNQISFNPATIVRILVAIALLLLVANMGGQLLRFSFGEDDAYLRKLILLFHFDHEGNIPTYFSLLLILFVATLLALIAELNRKQMHPHVSKWMTLSMGFLYIAFDEAFQIHEKLIWPFQSLIGEDNLGVFYFAWVIPATFIVIMLGLFFLKFLLYLSFTERSRFLIAAAIYLGGALGMELIGGRHVELYGEENWGYSLITTLEEGFEISGLIFFIWALLKYCEEHFSSVQFHFKT